MTKQQIINFHWSEYHPLDCVALGRKYFPNKKYWELTQNDINIIVTKENNLS